MRRTLVVLLAVLAAGVGSTLVALPAEAAPKPVTIKKIPTRYVDWDGTAVVRPNVTKAKKVKVYRKLLIVRQGGKVIRRDRPAVKLRPGTYVVTTKVRYKAKGKKRTAVARQKLRVVQGRCATRADWRSVRIDPGFSPSVTGDSPAVVATKLRSTGVSSTYAVQDAIDALVAYRETIADDPAALADVDARIAALEDLLARGIVSITDREYAGCGGRLDVLIEFANDTEAISSATDAA